MVKIGSSAPQGRQGSQIENGYREVSKQLDALGPGAWVSAEYINMNVAHSLKRALKKRYEDNVTVTIRTITDAKEHNVGLYARLVE